MNSWVRGNTDGFRGNKEKEDSDVIIISKIFKNITLKPLYTIYQLKK